MSTVNANFAIFDSNNFATSVTGLNVLAIDPDKQPKRKLASGQIARTNKRKTNSAFYVEKYVTVRIGITATTRDVLEGRIDTFNGLVQGIEKELLVPQSGGTRKYTATLFDIVPRVRGGAYWEADIVFILSDNFGYDTTYTTLVNTTGRTSISYADQYNFTGSADYQVPFIEIYYTAISASGTQSVTIGNSSNGQQIVVSRTWTAGERLQIDSLNKTVTVNGTAVAFTGAFPEFARGVASLTYLDTFTTRTFNIFAYYYRRWV